MPRLSAAEATPALPGGAEQPGCPSLQPCPPPALGTDKAFAARAAGPTTRVCPSLETKSLPFSSFIFTLSLLWHPHISALLSATDPYSRPRPLPPGRAASHHLPPGDGGDGDHHPVTYKVPTSRGKCPAFSKGLSLSTSKLQYLQKKAELNRFDKY